MSSKRRNAEEIDAKLPKVRVLTTRNRSVAAATRSIGERKLHIIAGDRWSRLRRELTTIRPTWSTYFSMSPWVGPACESAAVSLARQITMILD